MKSLLVGMAAFPAACFHEPDPAGPACDNAAGIPCSDCDAANPDHKACYDAFSHDVLPVLKRYCLGCHSTDGIGEFQTGGSDSGLNFEEGLAFNRLMLPSFGDGGASRRVVPGDPESSALFNKIVSDANTAWFGLPMPQGRALIDTDPDAVAAIRSWIAGGAKPPDTSTPMLGASSAR